MKGLIYIVIYIVGVVILLIIVEKKYKKQMTEIKKAGMRSDTMIEFQEQEIPIQNTNPPNDIYKKDDSAKGIMYGMMLFFSVCFGIIGWILEGFGRYCFWIFAVWSFFGMVCTFSNRRERILSKGTPYPAVIVKVESYIDTEHVNKTNVKVPKYSMEIHYGDSQKWVMKGISITRDPRVLLENPYCTAYVWKNQVRVADFKVKECYINEKGKLIEESYLGLQQESMLKKHENEERQRRARDIANKQKLRAEREQIRELQRSRKTGK